MLRDYQQRSIDLLYEWFRENPTGNPVLQLPTGAGKSWVIAQLCRDALTNWPETRVLMLTHQRELIEQNAEKVRAVWPEAPLGIYSAGLKSRDIDAITFAGIQSVRNRAADLGHIDLVVIDECFTGETLISTPSGPKRIDQVRCGDYVYNQAGVGEVEAISAKPADDFYLLRLSNGQSIKCTGNHPFFTRSGWKEAKELAEGEDLFSVEDMLGLWRDVQALDQVRRGRENKLNNVGATLGEAEILLGQVCEEIQPHGAGRPGQTKNQQALEGNQAQTYQARREWAIAAFTSAGAAACFGSRVGSGAPDQNECWSSERGVSERLQGGHCEPGNDAGNRAGRGQPLVAGEEGPGHEEGRVLSSVRVESVTHLQRGSAEVVFNLQVSGHPSYFAGGVAVHNCHLLNNARQGGYRKLLGDLAEINPALRVIGLTATPYRLGQGYLNEGDDALFDHIIEPVTIEALVYAGYLSPLRSKATELKLDVTGVKKTAGEYNSKDLEAAVNTDLNNYEAVREVLRIAKEHDRKSVLLFCSGVEHAHSVADTLNELGQRVGTIVGTTPSDRRAEMIRMFRSGELPFLTNANVLTTGFDAPGVDLIALLRPTMSPTLYVQMVGRGMRVAEGKTDCLVLDFAGNVAAHGPITAVRPSRKGNGPPPTKKCPECDEILLASAKVCSACGYEYPVKEPEAKERSWSLGDEDIMGRRAAKAKELRGWIWRRHISKTSGKEMVKVSYQGQSLTDETITEYLPILHGGAAQNKAWRLLTRIAENSGAKLAECHDLGDLCDAMNQSRAPTRVEFERNGKFFDVKRRVWDEGMEEAVVAS